MEKNPAWRYIMLVVIVALGLTARLHEAGYNFDGDEVFSVQLAGRSMPEVITQSLKDTPHPPLHNILLHLWIKAFGASERSVRLMSVMFSGAFLLLSFRLLRLLMANWLALGMTGIFALSPLFVYYGLQARPYALIEFLAAANLLSFLKVIDEPRNTRIAILWAVSCTLLLYAQYLGALIIAIEIGFALLFFAKSDRLSIFLFGSAASALIVPWMIAAMGTAVAGGDDPLPQILWMEPTTLKNFMWFYVSIFGDCPWLQSRWLLFIFAFLGAASIIRLFIYRKLPVKHLFFLCIGLGFPLMVYFISVFGPKPIFAERQLLGGAIGFVVVLGLCIASLPRTLGLPVLLALLLWTSTGLPGSFLENSNPPWRNLAAYIDGHYGSRTVATQEDWIMEPLAYYRGKGPVALWQEDADRGKYEHDFIFVCRPKRCSDIESDDYNSRRSLLATWQWGGEKKLFLYEITGIAAGQ